MSDMREPITILIWAENSPGVLLRLAGLFSRRKINIDSLTVSETEEAGISRFTVVIVIEPVLAATIGRQIERMVEVRRVIVSLESWVIHREVALIRTLLSPDDERRLMLRYPNVRVVDRGPQGVLLECSGTTEEISAISRELRGGGLRELVRSGRVAVTLTGDYQHDLSRSLHELRPAAGEGPEF
jgi:acetolactate synthase-1/3 small subunit